MNPFLSSSYFCSFPSLLASRCAEVPASFVKSRWLPQTKCTTLLHNTRVRKPSSPVRLSSSRIRIRRALRTSGGASMCWESLVSFWRRRLARAPPPCLWTTSPGKATTLTIASEFAAPSLITDVSCPRIIFFSYGLLLIMSAILMHSMRSGSNSSGLIVSTIHENCFKPRTAAIW
jgi:hypothetical protein